MKFNKINHIIVFGGSVSTLFFLKYLKKNKINYNYFTNQRLLNDVILDNKTLKEHLVYNKLKYVSTSDINKNNKIYKIINTKTLGIGFGQPWVIKKKLLKKFNNKIVDFMGIPMPKFRGGAHYSWMILNNMREGGCYLQNLNEKTIQGMSDTGYYYLGRKYKYPKKIKTPKEFFNFSCKKEMKFLIEFLKKIKKNHNFKLRKFNERHSIFFPRLNVKYNGFINWDYSADEIVRFINAFDEPYSGGITYLNKKKVYLKRASLIEKNNFHSYCGGLIINKSKKSFTVAAKNGIIKIDKVDNIKNDLIQVGDRFLTDNNKIHKAKKHFKI